MARGWHYAKLSICRVPFYIFLACDCVVFPLFLSFLTYFGFDLFSCSFRWSFLLDAPLIFSRPADHVLSVLATIYILGSMVEARLVNVKNTKHNNSEGLDAFRFVFKLYLQPMIPPKRFDIVPPAGWG